MSDPSPTPPRLPDLLVRGAVLAGAVVGLRAALVLLRFLVEGDRGSVVADAAAVEVLRTLLWAAPAGWLLVAALGVLRGGARRVALGAALVAVAAAATHHWPPGPVYAPGFGTPRGLLVHAFALGLAGLALRVALGPRGGASTGRLAAAATALGLLAALGWRTLPARESASWPGRPNLVLVSLDTVRADALGVYGNPRDTTPVLDRFARSAHRFTRAYSHAPWTLTSHMTMFTGLLPVAHGLDKDTSLSHEIPTLAEELRAAGYRTLGLYDRRATWLEPRFGFARGFEVYRSVYGPAARRVDHALALADAAGDEPFFLFAHFFDAHSDTEELPYEAEERDLESLASWYTGDFSGCDPRGEDCASEYLARMNRRGEEPDPEVARYVRSLYEAGVRSLDRELERLFAGLEERGLLESTVVVVTADHGEEFGEHGRFLHDQVFGEITHVPLVVRTPRAEGADEEVLVGLADLAPTFLDLAGVEPAGPVQGRSLARLLRGEGAAAPRGHVAFDHKGRTQGLRTRDRFLVRGGRRGWRFFDLEADPGEAHDLVAAGTVGEEIVSLVERAKEVEQDSSALAARLGAGRAKVELSEDERRALEALGYAEELE